MPQPSSGLILILFAFLASIPASESNGQQWNSIANHGVVIQDQPASGNSTILPTAPGEVVVWSNESTVLSDIEEGSIVVYPEDYSGRTSVTPWYTSRRPTLVRETPNSDQWKTIQPAHPNLHTNYGQFPIPQQNTTVWVPRTSERMRPTMNERTMRMRPSIPQGNNNGYQANQPQRTTLFPRLMELERRKNAWLREQFGS